MNITLIDMNDDILLNIIFKCDAKSIETLFKTNKWLKKVIRSNITHINDKMIKRINVDGVKLTYFRNTLLSLNGNPAVVFPNRNAIWYNANGVCRIKMTKGILDNSQLESINGLYIIKKK